MKKGTYKKIMFICIIQIILSIINTVIAFSIHNFEIEYYIMFLLYCLSCSIIFLMMSDNYGYFK